MFRHLSLSKRLAALVAVAALGLISACGSTKTADQPQGDQSTSGPVTYPMQITTPYGTTTLKSEPKRVVIVGAESVDTVLALGVTPVGAAGWGDYSDNDWMPWADTNGIGKTLEPDDSGAADFQEVLKLQPDLIIAVGGFEDLGKGYYDNYAKIAPVVTYPTKLPAYAVGDPIVTLRTIARPLNKVAEGEALIKAYQDKLASVRQAHPEFQGKTVTLMDFAGSGVGVRSTAGSASEKFFTSLGFKPNPLTAAVKGEVPEEKYNLLDADVLLAEDNGDVTKEVVNRLRANPLFKELKAVKSGAFLYLDEYPVLVPTAAPLSEPSLPGLTWLLGVLPDYLAKSAKAADAGQG